MRYAKGGIIPGKVDFTAENGERIIPLADIVHKPDYSYEADMVRRLKEWQELDKAIQGDADTIYVYNESKDKMFSLNELTDSEFIKVAEQFCKEADLRILGTLPPFKAKKTNIVDDMYLKLRLGGGIDV